MQPMKRIPIAMTGMNIQRARTTLNPLSTEYAAADLKSLTIKTAERMAPASRQNNIGKILAHESAGAGCCGCVIPVIQGSDTELRCNECGMVIGVINTAILRDLVAMIPECEVNFRRAERIGTCGSGARRRRPTPSEER